MTKKELFDFIEELDITDDTGVIVDINSYEEIIKIYKYNKTGKVVLQFNNSPNVNTQTKSITKKKLFATIDGLNVSDNTEIVLGEGEHDGIECIYKCEDTGKIVLVIEGVF